MEDRTYIKLFRKILKWGWYGDTNTFRVFMHILLKANYKPKEYKGVMINSGECVFGRKAWAKELGLSEQNIRTALKHLQSTGEITIRKPTRNQPTTNQQLTNKATNEATNASSIIHVEKWAFWQMNDASLTNEVTNASSQSQHESNQQLTTSKESKKLINKKNHSYRLNGKRTQDMTSKEKDDFLAAARARLYGLTQE